MAKVTSAALKAKIQALQAQLVIVEAEEKASQIVVVVGASLSFNFGRGDNRKSYAGVVRGIAETEKGTRYKVAVGEGFDEELFVISQGDIVVDAVVAGEVVGDTGGASADPLALLS